MIQVRNLTKTFEGRREKVLDSLSIDFKNTGIYYLLGKSGSGKTTFLTLLGGMDYSYEGSIKVNGQELKLMNETEKADYLFHSVSFAFQDFKADERETVRSNLMKGMYITDLSEEEKIGRIRKRLSEVGLKDKEKSLFSSLSGGEKKRISLARALLLDNPILLCDEPFSSLNLSLRKEIQSLLIRESRNRLVIIITHETDEIPENVNILSLCDGKLESKRTIDIKENIIIKPSYKRVRFKGRSLFKEIIYSFISKRRFLLLAIFTLAISLFSISFSSLLSKGVSSSLLSSLSSYMEDNSLVLKPEEDSFSSTRYESADYQTLLLFKRDHPDIVSDVSSFYLSSLDDIFKEQESLSFCYQNRSVNASQLSLDSFLECQNYAESNIESSLYPDLSEEEIILGLNEEMINGLSFLLFDKKAVSIDESLRDINSFLLRNNVYLRLKASKNDWSYNLDHSFAILAVTFNENCIIINDNPFFNQKFVSECMHFEERPEEEGLESKKPWTLIKTYGLRLFPSMTEEFLPAFLQDSNFDYYCPKVNNRGKYYQRKEYLTHNRIILYKDYLPKISINEVESFVRENTNRFSDISYSSPVYTYTANGYISGFRKPFFFSRHKEKLNSIQDEFYQADVNLGEFQGSLIAAPEGVIKADLLSAASQEGLSFISLDEKRKAKYGRNPLNYKEVAISSRLAEYLFSQAENSLDQTLHCLTLEKSVLKDDSYLNLFQEGSLSITGIYEEERMAIYQNSLFPLAYCFSHLELSLDECRIDEAVIKADFSKDTPDNYLSLVKEKTDMIPSFPMVNMVREIKITLNNLSAMFLFFALLCLISSMALLSLAMFLILKKDRKKLAILLTLGYRKKEISFFFFSFMEFIGLLGFLLSLILTLLAEQIMAKTLTDMLNVYKSGLTPYLLSLSVSVIITGILGIILRFSLKRLSPKDAFLHGHV